MDEDNQAIDLTIAPQSQKESGSESLTTTKPKMRAPALPIPLPPCRVCNAVASGFHYGANTCEACKAFFRRSIGNESTFKPCQKGGICADNPKGKISCSYCRHQKCLSIGMAKEGCKKGRYTKKKICQDIKEVMRLQAEENGYNVLEHSRFKELSSLLDLDAESLATKKTKNKAASLLPAFLPPCRVCNAVASGFHYGANTCEACKAFFRRSIGNESTFKPCQNGGICADNPRGKISCSNCRHQKCLSIGMAKEGCRKGRYTYEKRTQDTKEIRKMQAEETVYRQFEHENVAELSTLLADNFITNFPQLYAFLRDKDHIHSLVHSRLADEPSDNGKLSHPLHIRGHTPSSYCESWFLELTKLYQTLSTNPDDSSTAMSALREGVLKAYIDETERIYYQLTAFAKQLPGFGKLLLEDRIILLKTVTRDALSLLRHCYHVPDHGAIIRYEEESGDIIVFPTVSCGNILSIGDIVRDELFETKWKISARLLKLNFTYEDMAVLLGFLILMSDREGLHRSDQVDKLHDKMLPTLEYTLRKNHPEQRNILPDVLLILPMLRENEVQNNFSVDKTRDRLQHSIAPLMREMLT